MIKKNKRFYLSIVFYLGAFDNGKEALPEIQDCLQDQRPVIRGTAVWALGQLTKKAPEETIQLLQEFKETETDSEVLTEIANVLERLG